MKQEITAMRALKSKTFDNGDGTRTVSLYRHPIHFGADGAYEDIDTAFVRSVPGYEMKKANYSLYVSDTLEETKIKFEKKREWIEFTPLRLQWITDEDDVSVISEFDKSVLGRVSDNEITWSDAFGPGVDLLYGCSCTGVYKKVIIHNFIEAPESIVSGTNPRMEVVLKYEKSSVPVKIDGMSETFSKRRNIRFENVRFGDLWEFTLPRFWDSGTIHKSAQDKREDIGIRTLSKDEVTTGTLYSWLVKAIYPVFIDTDINEQIAATTDDCSEDDDTSVLLTGIDIYPCGRVDEGYDGIHSYDLGLRWITVNIPNSSTITAAKLSLYMTNDYGTLEARVIGIDEDNTVTWASDNRPSQRAKTTAIISANEADWNNWAEVSWIDIDISSVIQEIVNRGGWSSNNALAVVVENTDVDGINNYIRVSTYNYVGNVHGGKLDVTYTPPVGSVAPTSIFIGPFGGPFGGPIQ